ncbi:MAG: hypothetical protein KJ069_30995 [Anaerolineae bacterium]|nr:hypothetical protein [Anaerolineae bacterium]
MAQRHAPGVGIFLADGRPLPAVAVNILQTGMFGRGRLLEPFEPYVPVSQFYPLRGNFWWLVTAVTFPLPLLIAL